MQQNSRLRLTRLMPLVAIGAFSASALAGLVAPPAAAAASSKPDLIVEGYTPATGCPTSEFVVHFYFKGGNASSDAKYAPKGTGRLKVNGKTYSLHVDKAAISEQASSGFGVPFKPVKAPTPTVAAAKGKRATVSYVDKANVRVTGSAKTRNDGCN